MIQTDLGSLIWIWIIPNSKGTQPICSYSLLIAVSDTSKEIHNFFGKANLSVLIGSWILLEMVISCVFFVFESWKIQNRAWPERHIINYLVT